ncbi:uncharacterized protein LOC121376895 isoform X2 [Gigantopelta aegis]|uniref:uncharacterized protein LOC121376895 isoform X2 n=1 Tax=Gigantopelta aegis TaxID=1735272 RepID=UPI001B889EFC|nr:uncharacterized protein LOC121376895 isoform X2 [Gigantopelta aegis]
MLTGEITSEKERVLVVDSLLESLDHRFADAKTGILNTLQLLSFKLWPDYDDSGGFGEDHVKTLVEHYHDQLTMHASLDEIHPEWMLLKDVVYSRYITTE